VFFIFFFLLFFSVVFYDNIVTQFQNLAFFNILSCTSMQVLFFDTTHGSLVHPPKCQMVQCTSSYTSELISNSKY